MQYTYRTFTSSEIKANRIEYELFDYFTVRFTVL